MLSDLAKTLIVLIVLITVVAAAEAQRSRPATRNATPTFTRDIAPIMQQRCQACHRPQGLAPFPLVTYEETANRGHLIRLVTEARTMPPWKPVEGCGEFEGSGPLRPLEIETISKWVRSGMPEGDPRDLPPPPDFSDSWQFGEPDVALQLKEPFIPPANDDSFQCFVLPGVSSQPRYVRAIDFRPGARKMVHHILAYVDTSNRAEELDAEDPSPGYSCFGGPKFSPAAILGAWFPGAEPLVLPEGTSIVIPENGRVVLQVHYHPHHGETAADQTEMALYLDDATPKTPFEYLLAENTDFTIPAGDPAYRITASYDVTTPITALNIGTHAHWLAQTMKVEAVHPDGTRECLISIADWDPSWQGMYTFTEPKRLPAGTRLELEAIYDNTARNPRNPNSPPADVPYGEKATNEMCSAYVGFIREGVP